MVQRVSRAAVRVDGDTVGEIEGGLLALVGIGRGDGEEQLEWMADKLAGLRVFPDEKGQMNVSLRNAAGELLLVPQFTLYGDVSRGRRPSFVEAADPDEAERLYERFVGMCAERVSSVESGVFGAMMDVELVNDGPVTLIVERAP